MKNDLQSEFGNIDIYLFDQLLKGRYNDCRKVIDLGCGTGRNIHYFLKNGYEVHGIDIDQSAIDYVKDLSARLAPGNSSSNFGLGRVEEIPYADATFDLAICNTVLHFASGPENFDEMVKSVWRVIKPGGYFFARLASDIGLEQNMIPLGNGRYLMPDGTERFLVNERMILNYNRILNAEMYEPIKTTNVNNLRCMTTWCLRKER